MIISFEDMWLWNVKIIDHLFVRLDVISPGLYGVKF
jgi:hypothetical protein